MPTLMHHYTFSISKPSTFVKRQAMGSELSAERKAAWAAWVADWQRQLQAEGQQDDERQAAQNAVNPAYIPRNHVMQTAIAAAEKDNSSEVRHCSMAVSMLSDPDERGMNKGAVKEDHATRFPRRTACSRVPRACHGKRAAAVNSCHWRLAEPLHCCALTARAHELFNTHRSTGSWTC